MGLYYSDKNAGFYDTNVHTTLPDDAVEITDAEWRDLLDQLEGGKEIRKGANGKPMAATPTPAPNTLATEARAKRNALLSQSDWTQVADAPVDQSAWATYRQALRDITGQGGFPETIVWPVSPE